jgi:putative heme-binding domain-containing protein
MDRKIATGFVLSTVLFSSAFLVIALRTVISPSGGDAASLATAQESMKSSLDAARPDEPAVPAKPAAAPAAKLDTPSWIWAPGAKTEDAVVFTRRYRFATDAKAVRLVISADNKARVLLDGKEVATTQDWTEPVTADLGAISAGVHEFTVDARNEGGPAGICVQVDWTAADGTRMRMVSDPSWQASGAWTSAPVPSAVLGALGDAPWGDGIAEAFGTVPGPLADIARTINVPAGFICELVYVAPKSRGSIVALATDDARGRLIASAQYGRMFAITPCGNGGDPATSEVALIEPEIGRAHGILAIDNDLFAVVSEGGGDERGVWRLRDSNRDGTYDEKKMLAGIARDGGEHGPHQVVAAPDGSIWVVGGNHCAPPEESLANSRVPKIWQEDIIFTRLWDANGHAVGVMAPGGWIARTDREGSTWELLTIGFRNSYDLAFDEVGRAFTFDSDMEWDMGLPWYRPARVCELASGVDFGWRSGSGKWPAWSPDSLPAAVDIGPASPTGVLSSAGLQFPAPWNEAMFFLDWTYGTMWAGWPTDDSREASTPKLRIEPFVVGRPLPLTDAVVMDGAMYFAVGGRNLPSAVFRVRAENPIAIKRAPMAVPAALAERRELEKFHRPMEWAAGPAAVSVAFPALSSKDEGVRSAARIVLEHQAPAQWRERALAATDPQAAILALVALCRAGEAEVDGGPIAARLVALEPTVRGTAIEKPWLRACELWLLRMASKSAAVAGGDALRDAVLAHFPAKEGTPDASELDMHRAAFLAKIGSPRAVEVAVDLLGKPDVRLATPIDAALLARGGPYGKAVTDMMANAPATQKIGLVHAVRDAKNGWTADNRMRFARSIADLSKATGGNSYAGFLKRMAEEFVANAPEEDREFLASTAAGKSGSDPVVTPRGPGRAWTVESIVALGPKLAAGRDYKEGLRAYRAAQCAQCHRAGGIGGSGGPELSGVSRRFSLEDMAVSLVDPSKTLSDQYQNTDITLRNGRTVTGRIMADNKDSIEVRASLYSDARDTIAKSDIVSMAPSPVSPMPANLLETLSEGELLDLLAFLRAGGDANDPAFSKLDDDGYVELFSSAHASPKALAAFTFDPRFWSLENGEIVGRTTTANPAPHNTFLVWNGEVRDFELEVVMKVVGNNSGVQYRSTDFEPTRLRGPQIDAHPAASYVAMHYEEGGRGILAEHGTRTTIAADGTRANAPLPGAGVKADIAQWHTYRVVARGNTMEHFLDDKPTVSLIDDSADRAAGGKIGVQIHGGEPTEVRVRTIRLRRLDG